MHIALKELLELKNLNVADNFVYSMFDNANIPRAKYENIMREHSTITSILKLLSFDQYSELYYYIDPSGAKISPLDANSQIYTSLIKNNIRQYFGLEVLGEIPVPWGISNYTSIAPDSYYDYTSRTVNTGNGVIQQSTIGTINSYVSSPPDLLIQDCAKLLTLFQG